MIQINKTNRLISSIEKILLEWKKNKSMKENHTETIKFNTLEYQLIFYGDFEEKENVVDSLSESILLYFNIKSERFYLITKMNFQVNLIIYKGFFIFLSFKMVWCFSIYHNNLKRISNSFERLKDFVEWFDCCFKKFGNELTLFCDKGRSQKKRIYWKLAIRK
jgi:hypothetical protein